MTKKCKVFSSAVLFVSVLAGIDLTPVTVGPPDTHQHPQSSRLLWRHQHYGAGA